MVPRLGGTGEQQELLKMKAIPVALLLLVLVAAASSFKHLAEAAGNFLPPNLTVPLQGEILSPFCTPCVRACDCRRRRGAGRRVRRQVPQPVLAEEGRAVHGPVHDVLRQVPGLRAVGAVRQQGRVPLLQGHEVPQEPAPQVPLGPTAGRMTQDFARDPAQLLLLV